MEASPRSLWRRLAALYRHVGPWKHTLNALHDARGGSKLRNALAVAYFRLRPRRTVLCYPSTLRPSQVSRRLFLLLGYRVVTSKSEPHDAVLLYEHGTVYTEFDLTGLDPRRIVNLHASDIAKSTVERHFAAVFGYRLGVDPAVYEGLAVRKSEANYTHDAVLIECPAFVEPSAGVTYQRHIDTRTDDGFHLDMRVPVYDGHIPLVYLKYRPDTERRFVDVDHVEIAAPEDVLTEAERLDIGRMAASMGLDYGEMDVLRDNHDGRIYVVDVNRTPAGPPRAATPAQKREALRTLAPAFEAMFERRATAGPSQTSTP